MYKFRLYFLVPLKLWFDDVKNCDMLLHKTHADEICYKDCCIKNICKCRKWASIFTVVFIVVFSNYSFVSNIISENINYIFGNDMYFIFVLFI